MNPEADARGDDQPQWKMKHRANGASERHGRWETDGTTNELAG